MMDLNCHKIVYNDDDWIVNIHSRMFYKRLSIFLLNFFKKNQCMKLIISVKGGGIRQIVRLYIEKCVNTRQVIGEISRRLCVKPQ
jgi:hypothetical protein